MEDPPGEARSRGAGMRSLTVLMPTWQPEFGRRCCPSVSTTPWRGLFLSHCQCEEFEGFKEFELWENRGDQIFCH